MCCEIIGYVASHALRDPRQEEKSAVLREVHCFCKEALLCIVAACVRLSFSHFC